MIVRLTNDLGVVTHQFVTTHASNLSGLKRVEPTFELPTDIGLIDKVTGEVVKVTNEVASEPASQGWVADQISGVLEQVGDAISQSIQEGFQWLFAQLLDVTLQLAHAGSMIFLIYYCLRLMASPDNTEKCWSGIFFSLIIFLVCTVLGA